MLSGRADAAAEAALAAGKIVVLSQAPTLVSRLGRNGAEIPVPGATTYLDDLGPRGATFPGIVSLATAARLQFRAQP